MCAFRSLLVQNVNDKVKYITTKTCIYHKNYGFFVFVFLLHEIWLYQHNMHQTEASMCPTVSCFGLVELTTSWHDLVK